MGKYIYDRFPFCLECALAANQGRPGVGPPGHSYYLKFSAAMPKPTSQDRF